MSCFVPIRISLVDWDFGNQPNTVGPITITSFNDLRRVFQKLGLLKVMVCGDTSFSKDEKAQEGGTTCWEKR